MSTLLVDIGNTRIKWFFDSPEKPLTAKSIPYAISHHSFDWIDQLSRAWRGQSASECRLSNVANINVLTAVHTLINHLYPNIVTHTLQAQNNKLLHLNYAPQQIGSDRFAQLLGAQNICTNSQHLVISLGTATTIDGVLAGGIHLGGIILPSANLMRTSLHQYTAKLPLTGGQIDIQHAPRNTIDALATATHMATLGAIHEFIKHYMREEGYEIVLCGGGAQYIAHHLNWDGLKQIHLVPSLCLLGLKTWGENTN